MTSGPARRVMQALEGERPGSARFVGGCVRNALLDMPIADVDIATQLTPDVVERVMRAAGIAVHPTGVEHGTLTVVADNHPFEVTTLRRDVETDGRRAVVAFTEDWAEDAQRRDFRLNALYADPDGALHDPTGGGLEDARERRIVFVGHAETRIREDYLRILRFFRFNAWYGRGAPDPEGLAACGALRAGLESISVERIWSELKKLLGAPDPVPALRAMAAAGVLEQATPEAGDLDGLERLVSLERNEGFVPDALLRIAALIGRDAGATKSLTRRLKASNEERDRLVSAARDDTPVSVAMADRDIRRTLYLSGAAVFRDRVMLDWAAQGGDAKGWRRLLSMTDGWVRPVMPVGGDDVLAAGVPAGPAVGEAMRRIESAWVDSDFTSTRETLLKLARPGA
ncbi:MAG: CCA tRNA nucleotidyltransferase [Alphaproteobacteria bacterium]|nr:CCA tRNA nucleotidyltransferase [Alphaproteobacteria bacterium]